MDATRHQREEWIREFKRPLMAGKSCGGPRGKKRGVHRQCTRHELLFPGLTVQEHSVQAAVREEGFGATDSAEIGQGSCKKDGRKKSAGQKDGQETGGTAVRLRKVRA